MLRPSQKSRAVKDVNCKTGTPKDPCEDGSLPSVPCNHCWEKAALAVPSLCLRTALAQGKYIETTGCILWVYYEEQLFLEPRGFV